MPASPTDPPPWQTQNSRPRYKNRWVSVVVDDVVLPNGRQYKYTRLEPAGIGVAVIAFNAAGQVLLEREYRHGVGQVIWQLPGGLTNDGEHLREAGLRELWEETGCAPAVVNDETVRYLGMVWDNPAFGTATSHVYAAWGVGPAPDQGKRDEAEFVALHWVEPAWLREAVRTGAVQDRVVVAAVAFLLLNGWLA